MVFLLVGCTTQEAPPENIKKIEDVKPEVVQFDLGEVNLNQEYGDDVPVKLQGEIGVPVGDTPGPVVFVFHGSHVLENIYNERYDQGFTYLLEALAHEGYLAVSINVNAQYHLGYFGEPYAYERLEQLYSHHLEALSKAIEGNNPGYPVDLSGKGNIQDINLIGHSRSGQGIFSIFNKEVEKGNQNIKSLIALAPALVIDIGDTYPDLPIGIIIPELDGDVSSLDGQDIYDELRLDTRRRSWESLIYLYGANHNYFNEELDQDDGEGEQGIYTKRLNAPEQQDFFMRFVIDFLRTAEGENLGEAFNPKQDAPGILYGQQVLTSLRNSSSRAVVLPEGNEDLQKSHQLGGNIEPLDVEVQAVTESKIYGQDTAGAFKTPGNKNVNLLELKWKDTNGKIIITIPEAYQDFNAYDAISFYIAVDSTSSLNEPGQYQSFSVELADRDGNTDKIILGSNIPALKYHAGYIIKYEYGVDWSTFTPLSSMRIQLENYEKVNRDKIKSITLYFDQSNSGSIMLGELSLTK